jgi:ABC-2 type transport system ATP-binding protein
VAGAVLLVVRGVTGAQLIERLGGVPNARRAAIVKEEPGKVWARVYPKKENHDRDLARGVLVAAAAWQVEELHTEEGRLDEVFRSITLPETANEAKK